MIVLRRIIGFRSFLRRGLVPYLLQSRRRVVGRLALVTADTRENLRLRIGALAVITINDLDAVPLGREVDRNILTCLDLDSALAEEFTEHQR